MIKTFKVELLSGSNPNIFEILYKIIGHRNFKYITHDEPEKYYATVNGNAKIISFKVDVGLPMQIEVRRKWKQRNFKRWREK
jgi:hypothetical protein